MREGEDFYLENGRVVFTAAFHLRRGHCCGSGCRHCPYGKSRTVLLDRDTIDGAERKR